MLAATRGCSRPSLLVDRERALVGGLRLGEAILEPLGVCERPERACQIGVLGPEGLLADRERAAFERLGVRIPAVHAGQLGERLQRRRGLRVRSRRGRRSRRRETPSST